MKKLILIVAKTVCLLLILIGCAELNGENMNEDKKIDMLKVNIPYDVRRNMSIAIKSEYIERQYGKPELKRKIETKTYEIRNISDGSKLVVIYDNITDSVIDMWQLKKFLPPKSFKNIYKGESSYADILKIDSYTTILETTKNTAISEHRLNNNEVINIDYRNKNGVWIVENIRYVTPNPSNFVNILTEEDLKLIS
jgi:outer membrane lipoprotein-sorting protein